MITSDKITKVLDLGHLQNLHNLNIYTYVGNRLGLEWLVSMSVLLECFVIDLTADLTKYLQNCVNKLCSKSKSVSELLLLLKPTNEEMSAATATDGQSGEQMDTAGNDDNGKRGSISGSAGNELSEVTRWSYCSRLTDWLYHVSWDMWNGNRNQDLETHCCI